MTFNSCSYSCTVFYDNICSDSSVMALRAMMVAVIITAVMRTCRSFYTNEKHEKIFRKKIIIFQKGGRSVIFVKKICVKALIYHSMFKNYFKSHKIGYFLPNLPIELKPSLAPLVPCLSFFDPVISWRILFINLIRFCKTSP